MADPANPSLVHRISVTNGEPNSVDVHNGLVAVAIAGDGAEGSGMSKQDPGYVLFMDIDGSTISTVTAGALPDMLTFTPDGQAVLVANEGEPNDMYTIDPEGSVSYIDLANGASNLVQGDVTNLDFNHFEQTWQHLLRAVYEFSVRMRISAKTLNLNTSQSTMQEPKRWLFFKKTTHLLRLI